MQQQLTLKKSNEAPLAAERYPHGSVPISGDSLALLNALDGLFLLFADELKAKDHQYSCFINSQELRKLDYLHSFPQHATFPAMLDDADNNLAAFSQSDIIGDDNEIKLTSLSPVKNLLTPAACYHVYIDYQDSELESPMVLTTKNTCFRREKEYIPLERQWSFTMRELVCIGTEQDVDNFLLGMSQKLDALFKTLALPVAWIVATDPFFNPSKNPKYLTQKLAPNKWEMQYADRLAIGSRNNHRNYFGETFNININSKPAHSACVAFGLERWLSAFLETHGPSKSGWPVDVLESIL